MVKLEQMDWENVKTQSIELIRGAMLTKITAEKTLEMAEEEIKKFPQKKEDGKHKPIGVG